VIFRLYSRQANPLGWPSEEQGAEMRRLAREATAAYEEAFRLTPSDFERACVYARWHELHTMRRFEADSLSLRDGSLLERLNEPIDERLSKQVSLLRSRASRALDPVMVSGKLIGDEAKTIFLDVLADEYARLGRIGVPDGVFNEVLEDIPVFLQGAIHSSVLAEPKKYYITLRYHIWYALTGPRPDKIDNEYIDKQIETVNRYIHEGFAEEPLEYEEAMSKTFLELVELERGNRFIPRFKQPLWPFEWSQARNKYQKSIEGDILEKIDKTVTRIIEYENQEMSRVSRLRTIDDIEKRIRDNVTSSIRSLAASLTSELMSYQRPLYYQMPPGIGTIGYSGTGHSTSSIMVWIISDEKPVPPYPWKKRITPIDSCTASTRRIAGRVLKALAQGEMATLDTLIVESRDFSKQDVRKLARELNDNLYATELENIQDINDILIEDAWSWSAVRIRPPANKAESTLVLVFQWKTREYWLAWAGVVEEWSGRSLASLLEELKPGLELPPVPEPVEIVTPADIASVDDISEMESLESLDAGHRWRVQLALVNGDSLTPLKLLYCRAEWTDENRPPKPVPFGRYIAQHLGPVIWTLSKEGFRESGPEPNSRPAPPMSLRGDGCVYVATLPLSGFKQTYVQVYSAFDGRELARHCISPAESSFWTWGRFMAHQKGKSLGVATDFKAARPGMPAFRPIHTLPEKTPKEKDISINLSLKDGFFVLKVDKRILPTQGSRLLARWWLNDRLVLPQASEDLTFPENADTEGLANLLRLPAAPPTVSLKAKPGDKISLQVMLSPDRLGSPSITNMFEQSIACLTGDDLPPIPVLSNRISFKADSEMLTQSSPRAATAASFKELTEAIKKENVRKVRSLVATCPQLVYFRDSSNRIALDYVCYERPRARYIWRWKIGGDVTARYWKKMAEIAGILIDYGADVNAKARRRKTPLQVLLDSEKSFGQDENAPPVELVQLLLDRGADLDVGSTGRGSTEGTVLHQAVGVIQPRNSKRLIPVVEILLDYGADVFAISEPWKSEPVFDMVDSMKQKGNAELAAMISKYGEKRRKVLEQKVRLGVEEFLSSIRHAGEKELLALNEELPIVPGLEWLSVGRMLQKELGPALEGLGGIDKLSLKGNWAEVLLPTGLEGCLLYTSPSPRDRTRSRMPSSA